MGTPQASVSPRSHGPTLLAAAVVGLLACADAPPTSTLPGIPSVETVGNLPDVDLVFVGDDSNGPNVFGFRERDGALFKVTDTSSSYLDMSLSPSGGAVAVVSVRERCRRILIIDLETRVERAVSDPVADSCVYSPRSRWSPDGSFLVYNSLSGGYHLVAVNADGQGRRVLVPAEGASAYLLTHGWHPDGRIVYHRIGAADGIRAYVVNPDGSGNAPLFGRGTDVSPHWAPSGTRVAFMRVVDGERSVWVANADGSDAVRISEPGTDAGLGQVGDARNFVMEYWSPDGEWIVMTRGSVDSYGVDVVRADGTARRGLTEVHAQTQFMGWTKEGRVSFRRDDGGTPRLYTAWPDGSGEAEVVLPVRFVGNAIWRRAFVGW